ncbi:hypothetical protein F4821DRAFT_261137 [Hypoxylon rubiginosum]|uniref:Uncharacterized protein n=1 Tax=Hypoxylon rubiginosum TaxID=110542 RepID=A0ACC0CXY0_9PEZI|nr:hypothetical protein F4821DRAFT_261137 [Hypoxylon rubiginosum]
MAPVASNDDDHYDAAAPLDGGASPADLAGSDRPYKPTGLEIGVITAVVVVVLLSLIGLFVWRSRKNRAAQANAEVSPNTTIPADQHLFHPVESQDSRDSREPMPPPKFEMAHGPQAHPTSPSLVGRRGGKRDGVEEYEIAARF